MTDEAITFSELRRIQKEETRQDKLTQINPGFIRSVGRYLQSKNGESGTQREYKNAKRVFNKIMSRRREKIVKEAQIAAKSGMAPKTENMLPEEQEFFRDAKKIYDKNQSKIEAIIDDPDLKTASSGSDESEEVVENEEAEKVDYSLVKITSKVPEFMGTDLESYGPFKKGEKVEIPEDNAEILVNKGNAEVVET